MATPAPVRRIHESLIADGSHQPAGGRIGGLQGIPKKPRRLRFLYLGCMLTILLPASAAGQTPRERLPVIGLLTWASCDGPPNARGLGEFGVFERGLGEFGYKPGETVAIECRSANRHNEGFPSAAAELVRLHVDAIVAPSQPAAQAAESASHTIPIVAVTDSLFGTSFAAPGGNVTGVINFTIELTDKRLELLKEMAPTVANVAVLSNPNGPYRPFEAHTRRAADELGVALKFYRASEPTDLEGAFARMKAEGAEAVFVLPDLMFASEGPRIGALALQYRLPMITWDRQMTEAGCLLAYSGNNLELEHRLAFYVDRILNGVWPGDLPIEQPVSFWLSINLKAARALGIEVPPSLLLMADEVIE